MYDYLPYCFSLWNNFGLEKIVISPGSRSAPLVQASTENPNFEIFIIPDERTAAFTALGISQASNKPVALICTSGSAAYNYAPAIAEAFFTHTSLLILTADRPPEWVNQNDGQTIFQYELYGKHVVNFYEMPCGAKNYDDIVLASKVAKEAIYCCKKGPVHINLPFREPLYNAFSPLQDQEIQLFKPYSVSKIPESESFSLSELQKQVLLNANKILIVVGQCDYNQSLRKVLTSLVTHSSIVLLQDILSNTHGINPCIQSIDSVIHQVKNEKKLAKSLHPDLLITLGKSVLSKPIKQWIRDINISEHWVFDENIDVKNTFLSSPNYFNLSITKGLREILSLLQSSKSLEVNVEKKHSDCQIYIYDWYKIIEKYKKTQLLPLSDALIIKILLSSIPTGTHVHWGNSMPVRYANLWGCENSEVVFHCNRGTCGIDGSVSTAMGYALANKEKNLLVVGDMSFFYDRNAWWHNYGLENFKVILINNFGGGIFDLIEGANNLENRQKHYISEQSMSAVHLASEYKIDYHLIKEVISVTELEIRIKRWLNDLPSRCSILEIQTNQMVNREVYKSFFNTQQTNT